MKFEKIRVLETGNNIGSLNMAIDEFLLYNCSDPVLRIYGWSKPCISIGYFQSTDDINYKKCLEQNIDIVRRITGGGAVFHDMELTYSFVTKNFPQGILESYKEISGIVIQALKKLGLDAKFSPLNDVTVNGKKVCGNAQTRKNNTLLQHGTILLRVDIEKMFSLLNVPIEKISDKKISDVKNRVSGISKTFDQVSEALKDSTSDVFGCKLVSYTLNQEELKSCQKLADEKFSTNNWLLKR
ncbi:MAG: biotin/lipoate A/B protein ligase family protein [Nitrosopumilus sp.]|jgi:lipoate-protein ligase A